MNSFPLPDDFSDWPANPFELLGVKPSASADAVKRAYTSLIRRYKPDQFPEQFQRIRAAYDAIRSPGAPSVWITGPLRWPLGTRPEVSDPAGPTPSERRRLDSLESAWSAARLDDTKGAYRRLLDLQEADPRDEEVYLRLFWLCALAADIDPARKASDWLLTGLERAATSGRLRELWELEVRSAPRLALTDHYRQLIADDTRPASNCDLLQIRWEAAWLIEEGGDRDGYHIWIIEADVESLRNSQISQQPFLWAQVLQMAIERLAWSAAPDGRTASGALLREIDQLVHVREANSAGMHEFDFTLAAAREAKQLRSHYHAGWVKSIRDASLHPAGEVEAIMRPLLDEMAADPQAALGRLDHFRRKASALLWKLDQLVGRIGSSDRQQDETEDATPTIVNFLLGSRQYTYGAWRPKLLDFLISEHLLPDRVAALLEKGDVAEAKTRSLAAKIRGDVALRCLCAACRQS